MKRTQRHSEKMLASLFSAESDYGWFGYAWTPHGLLASIFGESSAEDTFEEILKYNSNIANRYQLKKQFDSPGPIDALLQTYFSGTRVDFQKIPIDDTGWTDFQKTVLHYLKVHIGYGKIITYKDLARKTMLSPCARAIGQIMKRNPVAPVVPCHRVIGSGGHLGGYSGLTRRDVKIKLLRMEGCRQKFDIDTDKSSLLFT